MASEYDVSITLFTVGEDGDLDADMDAVADGVLPAGEGETLHTHFLKDPMSPGDVAVVLGFDWTATSDDGELFALSPEACETLVPKFARRTRSPEALCQRLIEHVEWLDEPDTNTLLEVLRSSDPTMSGEGLSARGVALMVVLVVVGVQAAAREGAGLICEFRHA